MFVTAIIPYLVAESNAFGQTDPSSFHGANFCSYDGIPFLLPICTSIFNGKLLLLFLFSSQKASSVSPFSLAYRLFDNPYTFCSLLP